MIQYSKIKIFEFLRWSEKYTKTDMIYLASGSFWLTAGQTISSVSVLMLAIAFANLVPAETYGTYKYILSLAEIFAIFTLPGMSSAVSRATAGGSGGVVRSATRARFLFSLLGTFFATLGSVYYLLNGNAELAIALLIIALTIPFFDTFTLHLAHFAGKQRFDLQTKYYAITQTISTTTLILTLLFTDDVLLILVAYFLPLASARIVLFFYALRTIPQRENDRKEKEALAYGAHLTVVSILNTIAAQLDKILIWKFLGPTQLALYTFALAIPEQVRGPMKGISDLAFPKFAKQTPEQMRVNLPALWHKLSLYALVLFFLSLIYIALAPFIFQLLFPSYTESVLYSQIFALSMATGVRAVPATLLTAHKKIRAQYILASVRSIILITLLVVFIPYWGLMGAIIAQLVTNILHLINTIIAVILEHKRKLI